MKQFLKRLPIFLILLAVGFIAGSAFTSTSYKPEYMNITFRKRIAVKPNSNGTPDTTAMVQIGDADSATICHMVFPNWTDTGKVTGHKKRGSVIFNSDDTTLWIYTGARWKKLSDG